MAIAVVDTDALAFGVTGAGVVYNFPGGAAGATDWDILCVNSDALISTPATWTVARSEVNQQGSYIFVKQAAPASVTVSSPSGAGPFNATLTWARISGALAVDVTTGVQAATSANSTPAISTGVLAQTGEIVFMSAALHSLGPGDQNTASWSTGFTPAEFVVMGSGGSGCAAGLGYKLNAGTAAETPVMSWLGNGAADRYSLIVTFTASAVTPDVSPTSITLTTTLGAPTLTDSSMEISPDSITVPIVFGNPAVSGPPSPGRLDPVSELFTQLLACLCQSVAQNANPPLYCEPRVGTEITQDLGQYTDLCCSGLAYVALGDVYFTQDNFPDQEVARQIRGSCAPASWAQVFKMGIIRCIPVGQPDGEPPTTADWIAASAQNLVDSQSLRQAACCIREWVTKTAQGTIYDGMSVVVDRQTQLNPQGGCTERNVNVTIQFPNLDCFCS